MKYLNFNYISACSFKLDGIPKKVFMLIAGVVVVFSQVSGEGTKPGRKVTVLPVPAIGYSPETSTYLGAVTLFTFNTVSGTLTRSSNLNIEFNYTWNKQIILGSDWNYFLKNEEWFTRGKLHFSKYPDLYYGIGFNTPFSGETGFQSNRSVVDIDLFRKVKNKTFLGAGISHASFSKFKYLDNNTFYPELKNESSYGLKAIFLKDSRNSILSPVQGSYFEFGNTFSFGPGFYMKSSLDYRTYFGFGESKKSVLAGRFYHSAVFGNPPFYDYPMIGGDEYVRGYYLGRFRDKNFSTMQLEFRNRLFWRAGMAVFGGISLMNANMGNIKNDGFKPNAGIGIRFLVDKNENTNLRLDYAVGVQNQSGFYISFGESF